MTVNYLKGVAKAAIRSLGYEIRNVKTMTWKPYQDIDRDREFLTLHEACGPYSMVPKDRMYGLYQAVEYITRFQVPGGFVECGVWRGGSCMLMANALRRFGDSTREIHLYDTFAGMTEPSELDRLSVQGPIGQSPEAIRRLNQNWDWSLGSLAAVRANMASVGYPAERMFYHEGDVRQTLADAKPDPIALLRLDTDYYDSTKAELETLYPLLSRHGVLIIDDYGQFEGSRKAVDEYFAGSQAPIFLHRMDYAGRLAIKQ